jgi:hypothetical protein
MDSNFKIKINNVCEEHFGNSIDLYSFASIISKKFDCSIVKIKKDYLLFKKDEIFILIKWFYDLSYNFIITTNKYYCENNHGIYLYESIDTSDTDLD